MRRLIVAMRRTQPTINTAASAAIRRRHKSTDHFDAAATEKKIGELQRCVRDHLARQDVAEAVAAAEELVRTSTEAYGDGREQGNPVLAAARNDEALCRKAAGDFERAAELFAKSAQLYESCGMSNSASCATALHNLGACYKDDASQPGRKKMDRMMLLDRAKEALDESVSRRIHSPAHDQRDLPALASTKVVLASVKRLDDDREGAARELDEAIGDLRKVFSDSPSVPGVATALAAALNNRALHAKQDGDPEEKAGHWYAEALQLREGVLGEQHPLVIQTLHNIAEHLDARGDDDDAYEVRQDILRRLDVDEGEADESFAAAAAAYADSWAPPK
jgi:tetratricopeptide (TPR) repeat protein